jgi:Regulator of G protein signaling domain
MGSAASISIPGLLTRSSSKTKVPEKGNSIQDDARSFRSKTGAIKMLIRGEDSRTAFRAYLIKTHSNGEVEYLDYFLAVETIKKSGAEKADLHTAFLGLIKEYELKAATTKQAVVMAIHETTHSWQGIDTLTEPELLKLMNRSQDEVLSILTPNFEKFIASKVYLEYTKGQNAREKRRSSGVGLPPNTAGVNPIASPRDRPAPPVFTASSTVSSTPTAHATAMATLLLPVDKQK